MENTSGQGENAVVPDEIKEWNWGAFFLNAVWGVGNRTYIALLALIPVINVMMMIILGFNANKWAWRNKKWESIEQFKMVQRKWTLAGYAAFALYLLIFLHGMYSLI